MLLDLLVREILEQVVDAIGCDAVRVEDAQDVLSNRIAAAGEFGFGLTPGGIPRHDADARHDCDGQPDGDGRKPAQRSQPRRQTALAWQATRECHGQTA
jgi:hypothetical protein